MKIELRHVHKHFGSVHANNDISVVFPAGHIVGVLGENGAGKSTLMKILSGYQPADSGTILLDDRIVHYNNPQEAIAHGIGMLQQDPLDIPAFTVLENFMYGFPGGLRLDRRRARQTLLSTCASAGFTLDPDMAIDQLTIGQRQQLEIVRQLALGVRALILDEPTTGISAEQKQTLFDALRHLAHDRGMSILLVSHKLEDVIALCDDVIVLRGGRLVGQVSMPVTTAELVRMMFGQELAPPAVSRQQPGKLILELDEVSLRGQRVHIERYSLRVSEREIIGLAGLDGSGQDLILRACAGLVRPTHGHIRLNGTEMTGKSFRDFMARGVAFSAAGRLEEGLIAGLTLTEHMALVNGRSALIHWGAVRQITATQLTTYNVRGRPESRIEALSGGNQQRMLMALMPRRPVLMALEHPTRGLDVDSTRWIWEQLLERRDQGTAILFTSPDLDEIVTYSDRILVLFAGRVFEVADARRTTIDELGRLIGGHFETVEPTPGRM